MNNIKACFLLAVSFFCLSGCYFLPPTYHDWVRLSDVKVMSADDVKGATVMDVDEKYNEILVVKIKSKKNIFKYAKYESYTVGIDSSICRDGDMDENKKLSDSVYLYDNYGETYFENAYKKNLNNIYYVFIRIRPYNLNENFLGRGYITYDLAENPQDVCISIRGGEMLGSRFETNVIVIDKKMISDAVKTYYKSKN